MSTVIDKYLIQSHFKTSAIPIICLCIAISLLDPAEYIYIYVFIPAWHISCVATELHFSDSAKPIV